MLGIFGGTFDPIHYGHLRPAQEAMAALGLEQVRMIPAAQPPHRPPPVAAAAHRLAMVELAVAECPGLVADDRELVRGGVSYTVDTLRELRAELGARPLCLLMGADAFAGIESWHQWQRLPELVHLVVLRRPGSAFGAGVDGDWARRRECRDPEALRRAPAGCLWWQEVSPQDISATRIRQRLRRGEPVDQLVPPPVRDYIARHRLYRE